MKKIKGFGKKQTEKVTLKQSKLSELDTCCKQLNE